MKYSIIHRVKTKITTMKDVWIPGLNKIWTILLLCLPLTFFFGWVDLSNTQDSVIIGYPNTSNFVQNTLLLVLFSTPLLVFGYPGETMSLMFDMLHQNWWKETSWISLDTCNFKRVFLVSSCPDLIGCMKKKSRNIYWTV